MQDAKRTTDVSSNIYRGCEHCGAKIGGDSVTEGINHYIEEHGYQLLHVGTQTSHAADGQPWHSTVAVLGHNDPPAVRPPAEIIVADPRIR